MDIFEGLLWSYEGDGVFYWGQVVGGILYVGSEDDHLYALDASTGELVWRYRTDGDVLPSVIADGVLYAGSEDGHVYALDAATGELVQTYAVGDGMPGLPTVRDGVIYTGSEDGRVYAMDASNGEILWSYETDVDPALDGTTILSEVIDQVAIARAGGKYYGLDTSTGDLLWLYEISGPLWPGSLPTLQDGVLYLGLSSHVEALDALTGANLWSYETGAPARPQFSTPAVEGGVVHVALGDGHLHAVEAGTGKLIWRSGVPESREIVFLDSPQVVGEVVYIYSSDMRLHAFAASTGQLLWRSVELKAPVIYAYLLAVVDGVIYIGAFDYPENGYLYAVEVPFAN